MHCLAEALGMALPGNAPIRAGGDRLSDYAVRVGEAIVRLIEQDLRPRQILTKAAIQNGIRIAQALGLSVNTVRHLTAIAIESRIDMDVVAEYEALSKDAVQITQVRPNGPHRIEMLEAAGGVRGAMKQLADKLDLSAMTVTGKTLGKNLAEAPAPDERVIRPLSNPFRKEPGLIIIRGNLAPDGAVVKLSAVPPSVRRFEGVAKVFEDEDKAIARLSDGSIQKGQAIVLRHMGPKGGPGTVFACSFMAALVGAGLSSGVAVLTDGELSGLNSGITVGQIMPEAAEGGPLAVVADGDRIAIDLTAETIELMIPADGKTFVVTHDPLKWRETADNLLTVAGVRVLFHTVVVAVVMDGDRHLGVVIESNAGRSVILAKRTIDASGDAAVVARAGHPWRFGDQGRIQNPTMFFRLGGVDVDRFVAHWGEDTISPPDVVEALAAADKRNYDLPRKKIWIFPTTQPGELLVNATRLSARDGSMLNVINPEDWTIAEIDGRRQVREYARFLGEHVEGCEKSFVIDTGVECGVRQTRSIEGLQTLTNEDVVEGTKRPDAICRSPWPIELHAGDKPKLHWLMDDYYDVPYGALVPVVGENIIVAGRCLSAEHKALASARVTAQCFEYGHAAGIAAALSIADDTPFSLLEPSVIAARMKKGGSAL